MVLKIRKLQAWSGEVPNRPGAAAGILELLTQAGAELSFVFTRPHATRPDATMLFLAPIRGSEQTRAACVAGLAPSTDAAMLCVEGPDRGDIGHRLMTSLAVAGINLRGLFLSKEDGYFTAYLAFENPDIAALAIQVLAELA